MKEGNSKKSEELKKIIGEAQISLQKRNLNPKNVDLVETVLNEYALQKRVTTSDVTKIRE